MSTVSVAPKPPKPRVGKPKAGKGGSWKGEFYRQSRIWHGYLSAFAFLALIFFSLTGLLLNHPDWLVPKEKAPPVERTLTLTGPELAAASEAADPGKALAEAARSRMKLRGAYQSGETLDGEMLIRLEGVTGSSDLLVDLATGATEVTITKADAVTTLNELHRGKNSGAAWKLIIDISAIVVLALSIVGYVLFFSLRFRLATSLILTAVSLGGLIGVFVFFVP